MHNVREHKQVGERQDWLQEKLKDIIVASAKPQHGQSGNIKNLFPNDVLGSNRWKSWVQPICCPVLFCGFFLIVYLCIYFVYLFISVFVHYFLYVLLLCYFLLFISCLCVKYLNYLLIELICLQTFAMSSNRIITIKVDILGHHMEVSRPSKFLKT